MKPTILDHLPPGLLDTPANELFRCLSGPTLIHLPGRKTDPLVVSVLQHGNETSGWDAIRRLLKGRYQRDPLPRSLIILIGNVEAAAKNKRYLPHQPDFNRCWPGSILPSTPWHELWADVTKHIRQCQPFASIDIHNNTGRNPHYAAVNHVDPQMLHLASEFSKTVVYFTEPKGVLSDAFGQFCPSVTLECGLSADASGSDHAMAYLERALHLDELSEEFPPPERLELYQMFATLTIHPETDFYFGDLQSEPETQTKDGLYFPSNLDTHNFTEWSRGFRLAQYRGDSQQPLMARGHSGEDVTKLCFEINACAIETRRPLMPAMLTLDPFAIRNDCLCYLMERLNINELITGAVHEAEKTPLPEIIDQPELPKERV